MRKNFAAVTALAIEGQKPQKSLARQAMRGEAIEHEGIRRQAV
jgi:hypothetical protein